MGIYDAAHDAGGMTLYNFEADPRRLAFQFARYKHVAKLLEGAGRVLEVGCADGMGARIVRQHVGWLKAIDSDLRAITAANRLASERWPIEFECVDVMRGPLPYVDAVYSLDLFEHIDPELEHRFLGILRECAPLGIIGTPSLESQRWASGISLAGHVNCVSKSGLRERMRRHWKHVFVLGMNDETLHTGHDGMTHYLLGVGCG